MYYAQHFGSPLVMDRVCAWLVRLGFRPGEIHARREHLPCLFVATDWARAESVQRVIDALVNAAPEDAGCVWDRPALHTPHIGIVGESGPGKARTGATPIHWERRDATNPDETDWRAVAPLMERFDS